MILKPTKDANIKICLSPLAPGSAPSYFLPMGATCMDGNECFAGYCYNTNACAACDELTNYPCNDNEIKMPA